MKKEKLKNGNYLYIIDDVKEPWSIETPDDDFFNFFQIKKKLHLALGKHLH